MREQNRQRLAPEAVHTAGSGTRPGSSRMTQPCRFSTATADAVDVRTAGNTATVSSPRSADHDVHVLRAGKATRRPGFHVWRSFSATASRYAMAPLLSIEDLAGHAARCQDLALPVHTLRCKCSKPVL
jgi:hypothetical protein